MEIIARKSYVYKKWAIDVSFKNQIWLEKDDDHPCIGFTVSHNEKGRTAIELLTGQSAQEIIDTLAREYGAVIEYDMWGHRVPMFYTEAEALPAVAWIQELLVAAQILESTGMLGARTSASA